MAPTQAILPLSCSHGLFGNDSLYSELKISLETLFSRWRELRELGEHFGLARAAIVYAILFLSNSFSLIVLLQLGSRR